MISPGASCTPRRPHVETSLARETIDLDHVDISLSQHYAAKRRETPCQLGPHWDPVQFLVFFADPQGS